MINSSEYELLVDKYLPEAIKEKYEIEAAIGTISNNKFEQSLSFDEYSTLFDYFKINKTLFKLKFYATLCLCEFC